MTEKKIIRLTKKSSSEGTSVAPKKKISLHKKNNNSTSNNLQHAEKRVGETGGKRKGKRNKKLSRHFTVKICTSKKSCGDNYGPYIWERVCNEHNQPHDIETFESHGITYTKSPCQGFCKKKSNVQVTDNNQPIAQFHYMTPIKTAKLIDHINKGANPKNIKRL